MPKDNATLFGCKDLVLFFYQDPIKLGSYIGDLKDFNNR